MLTKNCFIFVSAHRPFSHSILYITLCLSLNLTFFLDLSLSDTLSLFFLSFFHSIYLSFSILSLYGLRSGIRKGFLEYTDWLNIKLVHFNAQANYYQNALTFDSLSTCWQKIVLYLSLLIVLSLILFFTSLFVSLSILHSFSISLSQTRSLFFFFPSFICLTFFLPHILFHFLSIYLSIFLDSFSLSPLSLPCGRIGLDIDKRTTFYHTYT